MSHVLAQHQVQVALAEDQGPVQQLATRSQVAFIRGVLGPLSV